MRSSRRPLFVEGHLLGVELLALGRSAGFEVHEFVLELAAFDFHVLAFGDDGVREEVGGFGLAGAAAAVAAGA